ncbi:3-phosphoshikimate 1-carboxyvinyltransferase [Candidatus Riesia pediculischaeffi]|uniref:3-phosphoshikimate 1-carboxyvinyltransferase n=1 Tax=Candidatus Riesia pediculischaeffi PTSU TaxID=1401651 RepID=A0A0C1V630_9ENTR|nr:3-phosphoshikimate 1-carboxyvinyltransferase [Candidatus Riesia pediculischaeffi]KIE63879.1 5-Enolpyruvylshikimate-3-phosphate synthase [Candidatus Riesia pediculischaeffi PTSU]
MLIPPITYLKGNVEVPGSKSISNRVLLLSALSQGITTITNLSNCQDTKVMLLALKKIGIKYDLDHDNSCIIYGNPNRFRFCRKGLKLFLGNSGISMRLLTAVFSVSENDVILTGTKRMQERPIKQLVSSLGQGGARIIYQKRYGFPPIRIFGGFHGGKITISSNISSQFVSALLISSPLISNSVKISVGKHLVSKTYVDMTLKMMRLFNVHVESLGYQSFEIDQNQQYVSPGRYHVEPDITSSSYFIAASAIVGKKIKINGINRRSIQGDLRFIEIIQRMGANILWKENCIESTKGDLFGIEVDAEDIPDSAMTIAILALFAKGRTIIRNIDHWRFKESDRMLSMIDGLSQAGAHVEENESSITIHPPKKIKQSKIRTYDDHRIAMCFSLLSVSGQSVFIDNPGCVSKTFPNFFQKLDELSHRRSKSR